MAASTFGLWSRVWAVLAVVATIVALSARWGGEPPAAVAPRAAVSTAASPSRAPRQFRGVCAGAVAADTVGAPPPQDATNVASIFGDNTFEKWNAAAAAAAANISSSWKAGREDVSYMLEHVSRLQADRFLEHLRALGVADADIQRIASRNDARGGPKLEDFGGGLVVTGASLRYIYHSLLIVNDVGAERIKNVVEVGGGYGGLALVLDAVVAWKGGAIESYRIYDLGGPRKLQQAYLKDVDAGRNIFCWGDSARSGADVPAGEAIDLLTSTYACVRVPSLRARVHSLRIALFRAHPSSHARAHTTCSRSISEFPDAVGDAYLSNLVPRSSKFFFAWNSPRRSPHLPANFKQVREDPLTGDNNCARWELSARQRAPL
jgi:hypothetical protein